jgi:uncharacterized protein
VLLADVNVLVNALVREAPDHERHREWLSDLVTGDVEFGMSELVLSGVVRVVTNPRIYRTPLSTGSALAFVEVIVNSPRCVLLRPGPRHFAIFTTVCQTVQARGNTVPDAYHAALAIEHGCTWVTNDRGFARFPGLRWQTPFE